MQDRRPRTRPPRGSPSYRVLEVVALSPLPPLGLDGPELVPVTPWPSASVELSGTLVVVFPAPLELLPPRLFRAMLLDAPR